MYTATNSVSPALLESDTILSHDQVASFKDQGYLVLPSISTPQEVAELRDIFDRLFESNVGHKEGAHYDLVRSSNQGKAQKLSQIINPVNYAAELRTTLFRANALKIARELLGPEAVPAFEHAILKPARHGAATPWHQDEAHRLDPNFDYNQISIWMPLQQATLENGCMQYVPESHKRELIHHGSPTNEATGNALQADTNAFDVNSAMPCPIPPGGCTIHGGRTLHYAGPNNTDNPRRAYILAFELPPKPRAIPRVIPWNKQHSESAVRKRAWRRRGGIFVEIARKLRNGLATNPSRLFSEARRLSRRLFSK